jgi:hypothetical protein
MKLNKQNRLLVGGFILSMIGCYYFAFSKTIHYYKQFKKSNDVILDNLDNPAQTIPQLVAREAQLDEILSQYTALGDNSFQNELLKQINSLSGKYDLKVVNFTEPHITIENNMKVTSYFFSLQGSFNGVLLLINGLENNQAIGMIKHAAFIKKVNYRSGVDYLLTEVLLQKSETLNK